MRRNAAPTTGSPPPALPIGAAAENACRLRRAEIWWGSIVRAKIVADRQTATMEFFRTTARPHDGGRGARAHRARRMCSCPAGDRHRGRSSSRAPGARNRHRRIAQEGRSGPGSTNDTPRNRARWRRCSCRAVLMSCSCLTSSGHSPELLARWVLVRCSSTAGPCRRSAAVLMSWQTREGANCTRPRAGPGGGCDRPPIATGPGGPGPALDRSAEFTSAPPRPGPRGPARRHDIPSPLLRTTSGRTRAPAP